MNKLMVYTIKDTKAECYLQPFTFRTDGEAIRAFDDTVQRDGTPIHDHPEDFCLFKVGEFDQLSGVITSVDHKSLGCALDFVKQKGN